MQSSGMMAVWFGSQGDTLFPLGYTAQEREALERSDDHVPEEQGSNINTDLPLACKRRYGITLRGQSGTLRTALTAAGPDTGFVLAGSNGKWPYGDHYRRWDPSFAGGHAAFVIGMGEGKNLWWMDPEAPKGYTGELISIDKVMQWSYGDGYARVVKAGEYPHKEVTPMAFQEAVIPKGVWLYVSSTLAANANNLQVDPGRPMLVVKANATALAHLIMHDTNFGHYYVKKGDVTLKALTDQSTTVQVPPDQTSCKPYIDAEVATVKAADALLIKAAEDATDVAEAEADAAKAALADWEAYKAAHTKVGL